jgi:hypothetical protein
VETFYISVRIKHFQASLQHIQKVTCPTNYVTLLHAETFYWCSAWVVQHIDMIVTGLILFQGYHLYCAMQYRENRASGKRMDVLQDLE